MQKGEVIMARCDNRRGEMQGETPGRRIRRENAIPVVYGYGTLESEGVPNGANNVLTGEPQEVEFKITITRSGAIYKGEIYLVNYDTRIQISSHKLVYFRSEEDCSMSAVFRANQTGQSVEYELYVTACASVCGTCGRFFAYISPVYQRPGVNVGGDLTSGEINIRESTIK